MSDGDSRHRSDGKLRATLQRGHLWLIGALISSVVLLAVAGTDVRQLLRYERAAVLGGEWWRLLTGHLVHGGLRHLSLNMAGIGLVALLFGRDYSPGHWLLILLASTLAIDLGFVFYQPQLEWYVGLSGVLHGCIAAGLIAWWRYENRVLTLAVAVLLSAKLFWEQYRGALPLSGDMPVVVAAHLYGAIGGALAAASIAILRQRWPRRSTSL
jgi:rhomboid family GlyGly-CTERM serine protease